MAEIDDGVHFRVLGPLEVRLDGKPVSAGHRRERTISACCSDSIDVHRFRSLIAQARRLKGRPAIDLYAEADALWRGPVLAGTFNDEIRRLLCDGLVEERCTGAF